VHPADPEGAKVLLVINKIDLPRRQGALLPFMQKMSQAFPFAEIVPVCAEKGIATPTQLLEAAGPLPARRRRRSSSGRHDRPQRTLSGCRIPAREAVPPLGEELPYGMTVEIERSRPSRPAPHPRGHHRRQAGHKAIVIGKGGERSSAIASEARATWKSSSTARSSSRSGSRSRAAGPTTSGR
jgi:GTP-binding protein Era